MNNDSELQVCILPCTDAAIIAHKSWNNYHDQKIVHMAKTSKNISTYSWSPDLSTWVLVTMLTWIWWLPAYDQIDHQKLTLKELILMSCELAETPDPCLSAEEATMIDA